MSKRKKLEAEPHIIEVEATEIDGKKRERLADGKFKPHVKTEINSALVEKMAGLGIPLRMMAAQIGIDDNTIERHYKEEFLLGQTKATTSVAQRLFDIAMGDDKRSALPACIFWMKCRARWSEVGRNPDIMVNVNTASMENMVIENKHLEDFKKRWDATTEANY